MKYTIKKGTKKGTIVFVHGNSSSSKVFEEVMNANEIHQTKIAVDLPGHGSNNEKYAQIDDFRIKSYRDKLVQFVNEIEDEVLLVGNSLGGHISIEAAERIHRIKGLVIFGTPPLKKPLNLESAFLPVPELQTFFTKNPSDEEILATCNAAIVGNQFHTERLVKDFKLTNSSVRSAIVMDVQNNSFLNEYEIFTNLKVPRFIIAGDSDISVNLKYLKMVQKESKGKCELFENEKFGHYSSLEQPEEFTQILVRIADEVFN